jgi:hypothetical protein
MRTYEAFSYRDNEVGLRVYRDGLLREREQEISALPPQLTRVYVRRASRIAAGVVAAIGFGAMTIAAILGQGVDAAFNTHLVTVPLTPILLATLAAVPVVALFARTVAHFRLLGLVRSSLRLTGDTRADVERLERTTSTMVAERADALESPSVAMPLVGWALLAPLTIHFLVYAAMSNNEPLDMFLHGFDWWICASLLLTGVAHFTLAALGFRFAKRLREVGNGVALNDPSSWAPLGWTFLAGCLPGVILYLVPPVLVGATGLVFIPATFAFMKYRVQNERLVLDATEALREASFEAVTAA